MRQTLEREVIKRGADIEYATGNYEDNAEGEVRKDLDATFAKWENAKHVERCSRGRKRKAETGLFVCERAVRVPDRQESPSGRSCGGRGTGSNSTADLHCSVWNAYRSRNCGCAAIIQP